MTYGPAIKPTHSKRNKLIIAISLVLVAVLLFTGWQWYRARQIRLKQQASATQTQTKTGNESKRDDSATNTNEQNQELGGSTSPSATAASSDNLPTPQLIKSSGNNGPVPAGAVIEFVCSAPAGYSCAVRLTGPKTENLAAKTLTDNGRGQASVSWTWTAAKGTWNVTAVLSDGKGGEKASPTQRLEVQ